METCAIREIPKKKEFLYETQISQRCMGCIALALDGHIPVIQSTYEDTYEEACTEMDEDRFDPSTAETYADRYLRNLDNSSSKREARVVRGFDMWDGEAGPVTEETTIVFECPNT